MRHVVVALAALGMLLAVRVLGFSEATSGVDPRTLAAIGFVIVASFSVGGIVAELTLPKIVGYIVTGIVLGPALSDILSVRVVKEMQVFNTLALGLIALGAGLELDLKSIARVWKTLFATIAVKVPLLLVGMSGVFLAFHFVYPLLPLNNLEAVGLALLVSVLGIGTSPSIALAVVRETKAKGRLTDILLAMVVAKDLVVVTLLAVAIGIVRVLIEPDGTLGPELLIGVAREIGGSVLLGAVIASLLIGYVRFVHKEMLLAITALVLVAAELCAHLHLELLLVFITVGFFVRNFTHYEHAVLEPLEQVALPVFVVFFTTAGAALDILGVLRLLPLGLALCAVRIVVSVIASRVGGAVGGESPEIRRSAWLVYVPQAGVTLGLVLLASRALPTLSSEIASAGMAMVGLNLLVGPVLLTLGLKRTGDIATSSPTRAPATKPSEESLKTAVAKGAPRAAEKPTNVELRDDVDRVVALIDGHATRLVEDVLAPHLRRVADDAVAQIEASIEPIDARGHAIALARRILAEPPPADLDLVKPVRAVLIDVARALETFDDVRVVRLSDADLAPRASDGVFARTKKLAVRTVGGRTRTLRLRVLGRSALELPVTEGVRAIVRAATEIEVAVRREMKDVLEGVRPADHTRARIAAILEHGFVEVRAVFRASLAGGTTQLARALDGATIPGSRAPRLRLSNVQSRADAEAHALLALCKRARAYASAAHDTVRAEAALFVLTERLSEVQRTRLTPSVANLVDEIAPEMKLLREQLENIRTATEGSEKDPTALAALAQRTSGVLGVRGRARIRRATARHRRETQANVLFAELIGALPDLPERVALLPTLDAPAANLPQPVSVLLVDRVRERLESTLQRLQELNQAVLDVALPFASQVEESLHAATFSFELASRTKDEHDDPAAILKTSIERAVHRLDELERALVEAVESSSKGFEEIIEDTMRDLEGFARVRETPGELMRTSVRATRRRFTSRIDEVIDVGRRQLARVTGFFAGVSARSDVHDYLVRTGRERLDATQMRAHLQRELATPSSDRVPAIYAKLFDLSPLDDVRLLVSHRAQLDELSALRTQGQEARLVLVVGEPGSGKTTLIQALLRRLSSSRVVVLDSALHARALGVVGAIAEELGCEHALLAVADRLGTEPTTVLIDDVERHLPMGERLVDEAGRLLQLMRMAHKDTRFIVNTKTIPQRALDELLPFSSAFDRVLRLRGLDVEGMREIIEFRRRLTGMRLEFEQGIRLFARAGPSTRPERHYFAWLVAASRGNLRTALLLHLKSIAGIDGDAVVVRPGATARIPFMGQLSPEALATLGLLCRHGPMETRLAAEALQVRESDAEIALMALTASGLVVERPGFDIVEYEIASSIESIVARELEDLGVVRGGAR